MDIFAYVGENMHNGIGVDRRVGTSYRLTDFHGAQIGTCTLATSWRVNSYIGSRMYQIYARVDGRDYTGRGFGEGMSVRLRETAESKRRNGQ